MSDEWDEELDEVVDQLGRRYRRIEAPAYLATRIRAEAANQPTRRSWLPATAVLAAAVVVLAMVLPLYDKGKNPIAPTSMTVLSLAAASTPSISSLSAPNLSRVGSPRLPPPPSLHELRRDTSNDASIDLSNDESNDEFDTSFEYRRRDSDQHREKNHAYG